MVLPVAVKTTLTKSYSGWLKRNEFKVAIVNLDPGVRKLPYKPDFDIRSIFALEELMIKYNLGPNGVFIKSNELLLENINLILSSRPFRDKFLTMC